MIVAIFLRRLKEGKDFEDFKSAWEAEKGFGVPARVIAAVGLTDPRDILTVGFLDVDPEQLAGGMDSVAEQEQVRHDRIADVLESTQLKAMYVAASEHDFSGDPREIPLGSEESLFVEL